MKWKSVVFAMAVVIAVILLIFFIVSHQILQNSVFWIILFSIIFLIILTYFLFYISEKVDVKKEVKTGFNGKLHDHLKNINKLLSEMDTVDIYRWDFGNTTRVTTRVIEGTEYLGVIGNTIKGKRIGVIYDKEKKDIKSFIGDPKTPHEQDVFYNFIPRHIDVNQQYADAWRYKSKVKRTPTIVNVGVPPQSYYAAGGEENGNFSKESD